MAKKYLPEKKISYHSIIFHKYQTLSTIENIYGRSQVVHRGGALVRSGYETTSAQALPRVVVRWVRWGVSGGRGAKVPMEQRDDFGDHEPPKISGLWLKSLFFFAPEFS